MNPRETEELKALIRRIRDELGVTVCLIEHDMRLVMTLSERVTVLNYGAKLAEGSPQEIRNNSDGRLPRARRGGGRLRQALRGAMLELENIHTYYSHLLRAHSRAQGRELKRSRRADCGADRR